MTFWKYIPNNEDIKKTLIKSKINVADDEKEDLLLLSLIKKFTKKSTQECEREILFWRNFEEGNEDGLYHNLVQ